MCLYFVLLLHQVYYSTKNMYRLLWIAIGQKRERDAKYH